MIGLLPSNNRIVIFSKTEKKFILRQTHKISYIYGVHMEEGWERGLKICNVFADIFCFSTKDLLFIFVGGGGWESRNWSFFVDVTNAWTLNGLKLQPVQSLEAELLLQHQAILTTKENNPSSPSPHSTDDLTEGTVIFSWFLYEKNCGLLNIASWLASKKILCTRSLTDVVRGTFLPRTSDIPFCCFQVSVMTWTPFQLGEFFLHDTYLHFNWKLDLHWCQI